jgi:recombination protein RecT
MSSSEVSVYRQQVQRWENILDRMMPKMADVLPEHIPARRLHRILLAQMNPNNKLMQCTPQSFVGSVLASCQIGLEISVGGQCWLIPYRKKGEMISTLVIGYKGYKDLAYRTGYVGAFNAEAVYDEEQFQFHRAMGKGDAPYIVHPLCELPLEERGHLRAAYMAVEMKSGQWVIKVLSKPEVLERKRRSQTAQRDSSPWVSDEAAMWKKTACLAGAPMLPQDYNFARAQDLDVQAERGTQNLSEEPKDFGVNPEEWEEAAGMSADAADKARPVGGTCAHLDGFAPTDENPERVCIHCGQTEENA